MLAISPRKDSLSMRTSIFSCCCGFSISKSTGPESKLWNMPVARAMATAFIRVESCMPRASLFWTSSVRCFLSPASPPLIISMTACLGVCSTVGCAGAIAHSAQQMAIVHVALPSDMICSPVKGLLQQGYMRWTGADNDNPHAPRNFCHWGHVFRTHLIHAPDIPPGLKPIHSFRCNAGLKARSLTDNARASVGQPVGHALLYLTVRWTSLAL